MSTQDDGFVVVKNEMNPVWDPCQYKNNDGESVPREKSDKSFMIGYYLGMDERPGKEAGSVVKYHNFQLKKVGDPSHLSKECKEGDLISAWGRTTMDDLLVKNVPIGTLCRVLWTGKVASQSGGRKYHTFEVGVKLDDTIAVAGQAVKSNPIPASTNAPEPQAQQVAQNASADLDDEDDMPF